MHIVLFYMGTNKTGGHPLSIWTAGTL